MREIKFRLRIGNKILGYEQWYIGDGGNSHWEYLKVNDTVWRPDFIYHTQKDQYTELKDKNDKEIYEGDILKIIGETIRQHGNWYSENDIRVIKWSEKYGCLGWGEISGYVYCKENLEKYCEFIGNIYENPKLLENK